MDQAARDNGADGDALNGFRREESVLLLALREGIRGHKLDPAGHASILAGVDWAKLVELAFENRVAALLHFTLTPLARAGLAPAQETNTLRHFSHETAQKNLRIKLGLKEILGEFERRGIEALLLKGAALAYSIWPSMALRQMQDVDIMVRREDVVAAAKAMEDMGYLSAGEHSAEWHVANPSQHHLPEYTRPSGAMPVEIHQFFSHERHLDHDLDGMWDNSTVIDFDGVPARVLSPDDQLINLCLHVTACSHFLRGNMRSLLDITVMSHFHGKSLNRARWSGLFRDARLGLLLKYPLYLSIQHLGARFDPEIEAGARDLAPFTGARLRRMKRAGTRTLVAAHRLGVRDLILRATARNMLFRPEAGQLAILATSVFSSDREFRRDGSSTSRFDIFRVMFVRFRRLSRRAGLSLAATMRGAWRNIAALCFRSGLSK